jgi:EAL and modified HD-GYP domain-containing signal transduction protein
VDSVIVARRPVFDRALDLSAYELLASPESDEELRGGNSADAVARLVLEVAAEGEIASLLGEHPAWLRLSVPAAREALEAGLTRQRVTIELHQNGADAEEMRATVASLQARSFAVAVEVAGDADAVAELIGGADIVAVDVASMSSGAMTAAVERLKPAAGALAASNVDAPARHDAAREAGFDLFRGEFFKKPRATTGGVAPSRLAVLRLLAAVQDPNVELSDLAKLLSQDVSLTYRLLRYINSAFFGMRREVTSISHALALLGLRNVKRWATVVMLADVDHRPRELLTTALVRARFCEMVGPHFKQSNPDQLFTLGLFSVLDALMDTQMARALRPLPLGQEMVGALTLRAGAQGKVLECALAAEQGKQCRSMPVDGGEIAELYRKCMEWGTETAREL